MEIHDEQNIHGQSGLFTRFENYLGEFVYGGIDGSVTTFAVVAGAVGAGLDNTIIIILGFANLIADGFSMSVGAYLSSKSEKAKYDKHKNIEYWEVDNIPKAEEEEIRDIYRVKGFEGEKLEMVVEVITADRDRWVDVMMKEELEMAEEKRSPVTIGLVTFISFILIGLIPLLVYVWDYISPVAENKFLYACTLTGLGFIIIGILKSYVTQAGTIRGIAETLILGAIAALAAYYVGDLLENLVG